MDWLRLWHDMPTDPKWRVVAKRAKQPIPCVIAVFNFVLVSASSNATERGRTQGLYADDVAAALDMEEADVVAILDAMQGKVLDGDRVCGWDKRQPLREDGSAERGKAWREAQKAERERISAEANAAERMRTQTNAREEEIREEKIREDKIREESKSNDALCARDGQAYAFSGSTIRLIQSDFDKWRDTFHAIGDLNAELTALDGWFDGPKGAAKRKDWFSAVPGMLAKKHQEALAASKPPDKSRPKRRIEAWETAPAL